MKLIASKINQFSSEDIKKIEKEGEFFINQDITITLSDVEISSADIPGWQVMSQYGITVALDLSISDNLKEEGLARELVNRIQNIRKDKGFDVIDTISVIVEKNKDLKNAIANNLAYICGETLAKSFETVESLGSDKVTVDLVDGMSVNVEINKL